MAQPRQTMRRYATERATRKGIEWHSRRGWTARDVQIVPVTSKNAGCGCLLGMFGGGAGRSKHQVEYLVIFERP